MTTTPSRTRVLAALLVVSMTALVLVAAGGAVQPLAAEDRPDDPTTEDTVGYVEGYWYDDDLAVDDRDDAALEEDELESVVYRSMARVEQIRDLTFEDEVPVDVISREEFQADSDDLFVELSEDEAHKQNVTYEALFMVDRDTDAADELEAMYGDSVGGYYDPQADEVVLVSDSPDSPEVDEVVLGHELLHALQDQQFDLTSYDRETINQDNAKNGLIEGDAVWVEEEYEHRCDSEWECLPSTDTPPDQSLDINWGIYMTMFQPYNDGPAYIDHLLEEGDWDAVDATYDDPPQSASTIIHREERPPSGVTVTDDSTDAWEPLEINGAVATETVGEGGMVAMFGADAHDDLQPSVIDSADLLTDDLSGYDYDQPYTDGWADDELVTYISTETADPGPDDSGYVWETEWRSSEDAEQFIGGYLELLGIHDAAAVEDRQDTYVIDEGYPGAYALAYEDQTVTIVRAPSVDDLDAIADGAAPAGEDTLEGDAAIDETTEADDASDDADDSIPGFAVPAAVVALALAVLAASARGRTILVRSRR